MAQEIRQNGSDVQERFVTNQGYLDWDTKINYNCKSG